MNDRVSQRLERGVSAPDPQTERLPGWMNEEQLAALLSSSLAEHSGIPEAFVYGRLTAPVHTALNRLRSVARFKTGHVMRPKGERRECFSPEFVRAAAHVVVVNIEEHFTTKRNSLRGKLEAIAACKHAWKLAVDQMLADPQPE